MTTTASKLLKSKLEEPIHSANGFIGIRSFCLDDAPLLFSAVHESARQLRRFMTWYRPGYSLKDSRAFIAQCRVDREKGKQYVFAIVDARNETLLGSIGLNRIDRTNLVANIGYWVRRTWTRRGVATAATRLIAEFGLNELGLQRLEILVPHHNVASRRVAEKAGARLEGVLRKRLVLAEKIHDARLYSLIPGDLTSLPTPHIFIKPEAKIPSAIARRKMKPGHGRG